MSTRSTALGLAAFAIGLATLFFLDGAASTVIGLSLLVAGGIVATLAGLFGVRVTDQRRADHADAHRDAGASAALKRGMETGRWPRVIGGG